MSLQALTRESLAELPLPWPPKGGTSMIAARSLWRPADPTSRERPF